MPGSTTSNFSGFYSVYVLWSAKDKQKYIGFTAKKLEDRIREHRNGKVQSTKSRRPLVLIYFEGSLSEEDARRRERYLKTTGGRRFLAKRLKEYLKRLEK